MSQSILVNIILIAKIKWVQAKPDKEILKKILKYLNFYSKEIKK